MLKNIKTVIICLGSNLILAQAPFVLTSNSPVNIAECEANIVSVTPCTAQAGAVLNDDPATTLGLEYDWTNASSSTLGVGFGYSSSTRSLVEIAGQCWSRHNLNVINSNLAPFIERNTDTFGNENGTWSGYYLNATSEPSLNDGRLYQFAAAMNTTTTSDFNSLKTLERGQGICPTGWHIPSHCEWMYLEQAMGMTYEDLTSGDSARTGNVLIKSTNQRPDGTNINGLSLRYAGIRRRDTTGPFVDINSRATFYTSTVKTPGTLFATTRVIDKLTAATSTMSAGIGRGSSFSVRCIKN